MIQRKILVIEDDGTSRTVIKDQLERAKFSVDTANTAHEGIKKSQSGDYCLIMLDLNLPDAYGLEISNHLVQPFVVMTSTFNEDIIDIAKQMGAQAFIKKPFRIFEVLDVLQQAIETGAAIYKVRQENQVKKQLGTPNQKNNNQGNSSDNIFIAMGCLIADFKISQRDAYLRLKKSADDNGIAIEIVADKIVKQYELHSLKSQ